MSDSHNFPNVLSIAGFDGSGGAGIQADIKTISALGGYATTVLTALPIQNTFGVKSIFPIPKDVVQKQLETVVEDMKPEAIKIGMVYDEELIEVIADFLEKFNDIPIILDPVLVSSSGESLFNSETNEIFLKKLFPLISMLTPNLNEASVLTGKEIKNVEQMKVAGKEILDLGVKSVLLKGGHLTGNQLTSLFFYENAEVYPFHSTKIETKNTHGTGCTLSSAITTYLALGKSTLEAMELAQNYVYQAILNGKDKEWGTGHGSLHHFYDFEFKT